MKQNSDSDFMGRLANMISFMVVSGTQHYHSEKKYTVNMVPIILLVLVHKYNFCFSHTEYRYVSEEVYELGNVNLQIGPLECAVLSCIL